MYKIIVVVTITIFTVGIYYFQDPPVPVNWKNIKIGMTREEAYKTLGWGEYRTSRNISIDFDSWNYPVYQFYADKNILVTYKSDIVTKIQIYNDYSIADWFERLKSIISW